MQPVDLASRRGRSSAERAHLTFWMGASGIDRPSSGSGDIAPIPVPVSERIRRLPGAMLLLTGYYADRTPLIANLLRRID